MPTPSKITNAPTFAALCRVYPYLRDLAREADIVAESAGPDFCANRAWYEHWRGVKGSLRFRTMTIASRATKRFGHRAYDTIYQGIYSRLPDCRACGCMSREDWE